MRKTLLLFAAFCSLSCTLLLSCSTSESARAEKSAREAALNEIISEGLASRHYSIDIDRAYPDGRASVINLTSLYSVTVSGDTLISYLPFFGRAYNVPYGGGKGLNFTGKIRKYSESKNRKGEQNILMDVTSDEDTYLYYITIYKGGYATVDVQPHQRSHIYFSGNYHTDE